MYDLVVIQAFGDLSHVDELPTSENVIFLSYREEINRLLKKLYPKHEVIHVSIRFDEIFKVKRAFSSIYKINQVAKKINIKKVANVFTFSNGYDWITPMLVKKITYAKPIYILDIYKNTISSEKSSLKAKLKAMYLSLISGVKFEPFTIQHYNAFTFNNFQFIEPTVAKTSRKYLMKIDDPDALVIIDSPVLGVINYQINMKNIISRLLSKGKSVYFKPHPRSGTELNLPIRTLPLEIPIEFIDLSKAKAVIGIASAAMYHNNAPSTISVINNFEFKENHLKDAALKALSRNNIEVVEDIEEWLQL